MFRFFATFCVLVSVAFASSYRVQLGSFESYDALIASVSKVQGQVYKNTLNIEEKDDQTYTAYSKTYHSLPQAQNALAAYSTGFAQAYITKDGAPVGTQESEPEPEPSQEDTVSKPSSLWQSVQTSAPNATQPKQAKQITQTPQKSLSFAKELQRKVFYLCYEGAPQGRAKGKAKPVIKAVFDGNFITYSSRMLELPPIPTPYRIKGNDLHVTVGMFSVGSTTSRLERVTDRYLCTLNWADGKQVPSVRFYYNERDALAFARRK